MALATPQEHSRAHSLCTFALLGHVKLLTG